MKINVKNSVDRKNANRVSSCAPFRLPVSAALFDVTLRKGNRLLQVRATQYIFMTENFLGYGFVSPFDRVSRITREGDFRIAMPNKAFPTIDSYRGLV